MALSLQQTIVGYRISNVYDVNAKTYLLKLSKPDSKVLLLRSSPDSLAHDRFARDKGRSVAFTLKLRKSLHNKRIEAVEQLGSDRVIVLTCGSASGPTTWCSRLYDKGNVLVTDPAHVILTLLRSSKHDSDSRLTVGDIYPMRSAQEVASVGRDALVEAMRRADGRPRHRGSC